MEKTCTTKNRIKDEHRKRHISETLTPKSKIWYSQEPSAWPQRINTPKKRRWLFQIVKTEETFSSQGQKQVETTNL